MPLIRKGVEIRSVDQWFALAPPKQGIRQWADGRSAKELAKAWFRCGRPEVPSEVSEVFDSCRTTRGLQIDLAIPEAITRIDNFRGEHRNHDLLVHARLGEHPVLVGVAQKSPKAWRQYKPFLMLRYNGWPMVLKEGAHMIAAYDMDKKLAAIAAADYGKGRVVAFRPHPEGATCAPGIFRDRDQASFRVTYQLN